MTDENDILKEELMEGINLMQGIDLVLEAE
jgi:hypothetical protein